MINEREQILFELADNAVMTKGGLLKRCQLCGKLLIFDCFPRSKDSVWKRGPYCHDCMENGKIG